MPQPRLATEWRTIDQETPPFGLKGDLVVLESNKWERLTVTFKSFEEFVEQDGLSGKFDERLQLGLIPQPYMGSLSSATVFLLMANPGFCHEDYLEQQSSLELRHALWGNLCQEPSEYPFSFLAPELAWSQGAAYWRKRLQWLVLRASAVKSYSYFDALRYIANSICCLQLVPYHSSRFALRDSHVKQLLSPVIVREFVHSELLPKAEAGEILLVVVRRAKDWCLEEQTNVVKLSGRARRGAFFGESTKGGKAIAQHLGIAG